MTQILVNGKALAAIRISQGWSQRALAREIGISSGYLCEIEAERKTPSPKIAKALAVELGVPLGSFYRVGEAGDAA